MAKTPKKPANLRELFEAINTTTIKTLEGRLSTLQEDINNVFNRTINNTVDSWIRDKLDDIYEAGNLRDIISKKVETNQEALINKIVKETKMSASEIKNLKANIKENLEEYIFEKVQDIAIHNVDELVESSGSEIIAKMMDDYTKKE